MGVGDETEHNEETVVTDTGDNNVRIVVLACSRW